MGPVVPVPRGDHLPLRAARLFLLCVSLEFFATPTRRYHGRMLIHPSSHACATHGPEVLAHTQVRETCESAAACLGTPWEPHPPGLALVNFVMDRARLLTDHRLSGLPIRAKYKHFRKIESILLRILLQISILLL